MANDQRIHKRNLLDALHDKSEKWAKDYKTDDQEESPYDVVVSSLEMNDWQGNFVICNNENDEPYSIVENFIFALDEIYGFEDCYQEIDLYLSSLSKREYEEMDFDWLVEKVVNTAYQSI